MACFMQVVGSLPARFLNAEFYCITVFQGMYQFPVRSRKKDTFGVHYFSLAH